MNNPSLHQQTRGQSFVMGWAFILLFSAASFSKLSAQTISYTNNFDSFTNGQAFTSTAVSGVTGNDNGTTTRVMIVNTTSNSSPQSLYELDNNTGATTTATFNFGLTTSAVVTNVNVSLALNLNTTAGIAFLTGAGASNFSLVHEGYAGAGGASSWELRSGASTVLAYVTDSSISYTPATWNTAHISFNEATDSFNLTINSTTAISVVNGTLVNGTAVGTPDFTSVNYNINQLSLSTGYFSGAGTTFTNNYDDLTVTSVPEPQAASLLGLGLVGGMAALFLRRARRLV